jgi:hypothetical protein
MIADIHLVRAILDAAVTSSALADKTQVLYGMEYGRPPTNHLDCDETLSARC